MGEDLPGDWVPPEFRKGPRKSVCGESFNPQMLEQTEKVIHPKSDQQRTSLMQTISKLFLFSALVESEREVVVDAMFERKTTGGEVVIKQGEEGDNFYVVESGVFTIFVDDKQVGQYDNKGSFGELALMYGSPRAATIVSATDGFLWALDRNTFREILLKHAFQKRAQFNAFLGSITLLENLSQEERGRLADALEPIPVEDGDVIVRQGDPADCFYLVVKGQVRVAIRDARKGKEVDVTILERGKYFGELALLSRRPRAASCYAQGDGEVARLSTDAFERLLGPCMTLLKRNTARYEEQLRQLLGPMEQGSYLDLDTAW
eukprot:m.37752 g.37752  ORF g.37752 m.37752 type:complete len:319 (+) comp16331_c0_seq2:25-981(+)